MTFIAPRERLTSACSSTRPQGYKTFSMPTQPSMKFKTLIDTEVAKINGNSRFKLPRPVIILLINVKNPSFDHRYYLPITSNNQLMDLCCHLSSDAQMVQKVHLSLLGITFRGFSNFNGGLQSVWLTLGLLWWAFMVK